MSDLFMHEIPEEFIQATFDVMQKAHWHTFQILTKRSERLVNIDNFILWPENVWMGVSVENEDYTFRIDHLRKLMLGLSFSQSNLYWDRFQI